MIQKCFDKLGEKPSKHTGICFISSFALDETPKCIKFEYTSYILLNDTKQIV